MWTAATIVLLDAVLFASPRLMFDPAGIDPGRPLAAALDAAWALVAFPVLLWRRRTPGPVLVILSAHSVLGSTLLTCRPTITVCAALAALFARRPLRTALLGLIPAAAACAGWIANELSDNITGAPAGTIALVSLSYGGLVLAVAAFGHWQGRGLRRGRALEASRDRAVSDERRRVARELHDIVAHSITVMLLQAAGARAVLPDDPRRASESLTAIESAGVHAVEELHRLLTALREVGVADDRSGIDADQPGLDRLPELLAEVEAAGRPVAAARRGVPQELAASVDLAAYRVLQESLTNALKHGAPGPIDVEITWDLVNLSLEVRSPTPAAPDARRRLVPSTGAGLAGLRERVGLVGGLLEVGEDEPGRWQVRAQFPLSGSTSTRRSPR